MYPHAKLASEKDERRSQLAACSAQRHISGPFWPQVVLEDKRQLCVFQQASQHKEPWLWWRFAASYGVRRQPCRLSASMQFKRVEGAG